MNLALQTADTLRNFLCDHFDSIELYHLARGFLSANPPLPHQIPPPSNAPWTIAGTFLDLASGHDLLDNNFYDALNAARPHLRDDILRLRDKVYGDHIPTAIPPKPRLRAKLDAKLEILDDAIVAEIREYLSAAVGDRVIIESITRGCAALILIAESAALQRLLHLFTIGQLSSLLGYAVVSVEPVSAMPLRPLARPDDFLQLAEKRSRSLHHDDILIETSTQTVRIIVHHDRGSLSVSSPDPGVAITNESIIYRTRQNDQLMSVKFVFESANLNWQPVLYTTDPPAGEDGHTNTITLSISSQVRIFVYLVSTEGDSKPKHRPLDLLVRTRYRGGGSI